MVRKKTNRNAIVLATSLLVLLILGVFLFNQPFVAVSIANRDSWDFSAFGGTYNQELKLNMQEQYFKTLFLQVVQVDRRTVKEVTDCIRACNDVRFCPPQEEFCDALGYEGFAGLCSQGDQGIYGCFKFQAFDTEYITASIGGEEVARWQAGVPNPTSINIAEPVNKACFDFIKRWSMHSKGEIQQPDDNECFVTISWESKDGIGSVATRTNWEIEEAYAERCDYPRYADSHINECEPIADPTATISGANVTAGQPDPTTVGEGDVNIVTIITEGITEPIAEAVEEFEFSIRNILITLTLLTITVFIAVMLLRRKK